MRQVCLSDVRLPPEQLPLHPARLLSPGLLTAPRAPHSPQGSSQPPVHNQSTAVTHRCIIPSVVTWATTYSCKFSSVCTAGIISKPIYPWVRCSSCCIIYNGFIFIYSKTIWAHWCCKCLNNYNPLNRGPLGQVKKSMYERYLFHTAERTQ